MLLGGLGAVGAAWAQRGFGGLLDGGCPEPTSLSIVADASIAAAITEIATDFDLQADNCVTTTVIAQASSDTAALLASNAVEEADAWIPDSSMWLPRMQATAESLGRSGPLYSAGPSIASTPVVFAAPASRAPEFASGELGWTSLLGGTLQALVPDPDLNAASLVGLVALSEKSADLGDRQLSNAMLSLGRSIPVTSEDAYADALAAAPPTVVVTTEREIAVHNDGEPLIAQIAVYPSDGTKALDFPFVTLGDIAKAGQAEQGSSGASPSVPSEAAVDPDDPEVKLDLLERFATATQSAPAVFAKHGFRDGEGGGELQKSGVLAWPAQASPTPDIATGTTVLDTWKALAKRSRLLIAVDLSGSMLEPAGSGLRRIDIYQQAAGDAVTRFSGEVVMGVWGFSTDRVGDQDWEELVPMASLQTRGQPEAIAGVNADLPALIHGDTGLYDTVLAGFKRLQDGYDPAMVNSLVVVTDGRNDDPNGVDLAVLLTTLMELNDPLRPVPVIMVGFGPDTNLDAMQQIARVTGGGAYSALVPSDLGNVFVDALSQRGCRPTC